MKAVQNIKSSLIVGLDIETVRLAEEFKDLDEDSEMLGDIKTSKMV